MRCLILLLATAVSCHAQDDIARALAEWEATQAERSAAHQQAVAALEREHADALAKLRQRAVRDLVRIAERAARRGDLGEGLRAWRAVLAIDPVHPEAQAFVAELGTEAAPVDDVAIDLLGGTQAATTAAAAAPASIDLLALFDPARHAVTGTWTRTADGVAVSGEGACTAWLPYRPGERYDLAITLRLGEGHESLNPILVHGGVQPVAVLGGEANQDSGWQRVANGNFLENPTHRETPGLLSVGRHELVIRIRPEEMLAIFDGEPVLRWTPADGTLGSDSLWRLPSGDVLGLGCWNGRVLYESVVLTPHDDLGQVVGDNDGP